MFKLVLVDFFEKCLKFFVVGKAYAGNRASAFQLSSARFNARVSSCCCCCCCCLPDPFRGMGAWQKTMEPQKPSNSPGSGPEVVER